MEEELKKETAEEAVVETTPEAAEEVAEEVSEVSEAAEAPAEEVSEIAEVSEEPATPDVEALPVEEVKEIPEDNVETLPMTVAEAELPVENVDGEADYDELPEDEAEVEVDIRDDRDEAADSLIHWAAARAGAIVVLPFVGSLTLMANEVYMIVKIGKVYNIDLVEKSALAFIGALGGTVTGTLAATLIPIPLMQIPIAVGVTYGVGKAAKQWIKDGMPDDVKPYLAVFEEAKEEGEARAEEIEADPKKDVPLGDESVDFTEAEKEYKPDEAHEAFGKITKGIAAAAGLAGAKICEALKAAGVSEEQIENAKYTILGAGDVAKEEGARAAKELGRKAKEKSGEWKETAKETSADLREEAKYKIEELRQRAETLRKEADIRMAEAELAAEKAKAEARVRMNEAKIKAEIAKAEAAVRAEEAKAKAAEKAEKMKEKARDVKENAARAAENARGNFRSAAEDFKTKTMDRAAERRAEQRALTAPDPAPAADLPSPDAEETASEKVGEETVE